MNQEDLAEELLNHVVRTLNRLDFTDSIISVDNDGDQELQNTLRAGFLKILQQKD